MSLPPDRAPRCSDAALQRGDAAHGSAAPARRWMIVEVPGPWGPEVPRQSPLAPAVATTLPRLAAAADARLALIRRPGSSARTATRRWAVADSAWRQATLTWGEYTRDEDLLHLPTGPLPHTRPDLAYLVCTHGRHDACCAMRGRPLATELRGLRPAQTWECSHVGGDRFAANVVVLPYGLYYGRVTPADAADLVLATEQGRVVPDLLRGRSCVPDVAQAAQHWARRELGDLGIDAYEPLAVRRVDERTHDVELLDGDGPAAVTVRVRARLSPQLHHLTCRAQRPGRARSYDLVSLTVSP